MNFTGTQMISNSIGAIYTDIPRINCINRGARYSAESRSPSTPNTSWGGQQPIPCSHSLPWRHTRSSRRMTKKQKWDEAHRHIVILQSTFHCPDEIKACEVELSSVLQNTIKQQRRTGLTKALGTPPCSSGNDALKRLSMRHSFRLTKAQSMLNKSRTNDEFRCCQEPNLTMSSSSSEMSHRRIHHSCPRSLIGTAVIFLCFKIQKNWIHHICEEPQQCRN